MELLEQVHKSWGYGRASTEKQADSPKIQEETCNEWWDLQKKSGRYKEFEYGGWFCDAAVTSKIGWFQRPAAQELLVNAQPGDLIVISKTDRAVRGTVDACDVLKALDEFGLLIVFVDNPAMDTTTIQGRAFFKMMATFGELERDLIAQRTKEAIAWRTSQNLPHGRPPYGWKTITRDGKKILVPDNEERAVGRYVVHLNDNEGLSMERIYWHLRKEKVANPRTGRDYSPQTLREFSRATRADFPGLDDENFTPYRGDGKKVNGKRQP